MRALADYARVFYVVAAWMLIGFMGGAVYGWPSMRQILLREGAMLPPDCDGAAVADAVCDNQEVSLGLVFTVGSWSNQGGRFFVGIVLDYAGPRWTSCACALVCAAGAAIFAVALTTPAFAAGLFCIGIGGAGMLLSLQSVSALFPQNRGLVMAMFSGAFQAASMVFLLFEFLHRVFDISLRMLMFGYGFGLLGAGTLCLAIWPSRPFCSNTGPNQEGAAERPCQGIVPNEPAVAPHTIALPLSQRPFTRQAMSPEYLLMVSFFACTVLHAQFTIGTIGTQFEAHGDDGTLARLFNLLFSLSWIVAPVIGHMIDKLGIPVVLMLSNTWMLLSYLCLLAPSPGFKVVMAILYTLGRVSAWPAFFAFMGIVFGFKHFGKLAGGGLLVASCLSLVQFPLLSLTYTVFDGEFEAVNMFFIAMCIVLYPILGLLSQSLSAPQVQQAPIQAVEEHPRSVTEVEIEFDCQRGEGHRA